MSAEVPKAANDNLDRKNLDALDFKLIRRLNSMGEELKKLQAAQEGIKELVREHHLDTTDVLWLMEVQRQISGLEERGAALDLRHSEGNFLMDETVRNFFDEVDKTLATLPTAEKLMQERTPRRA